MLTPKTPETFSIPAFNIEVILSSAGETEHDPKNLQTRFVIWTIQRMMLHCWVTRSWRRTVGFPEWQGRPVGVVQIWSTGPPFASGSGNKINDTVVTRVPTDNSPKNTSSSSSNDGHLLVVFDDGDSRLDSNHIFLTALEGLGTAAEEGLTSRCDRIVVHDNPVVAFELIAKKDIFGNPLMRYSHVREAVQQSISYMFSNRRFAELDLTLIVDGRTIGEGSWHRRNPDLGNGTAEQ